MIFPGKKKKKGDDFLLFVFATDKYSHLNSHQTKLSRLVRRIIGELRLYCSKH